MFKSPLHVIVSQDYWDQILRLMEAAHDWYNTTERCAHAAEETCTVCELRTAVQSLDIG